MNRTLTLLCLILILAVMNIDAQTQLICNGRRLRIDERTTAVRSSTDCKACKNYILNDLAIDFVKPAFPKEALRKRIFGSVTVSITINEKGNVEPNIEAVGTREFQQTAIDAVRRTRFKKMILDCKPVKYSDTFIINFPAP